jgi:hypothetical protein
MNKDLNKSEWAIFTWRGITFVRSKLYSNQDILQWLSDIKSARFWVHTRKDTCIAYLNNIRYDSYGEGYTPIEALENAIVNIEKIQKQTMKTYIEVELKLKELELKK